jgi:hypothetical protein
MDGYRLVWATKVALAAICLVFPALFLGYYFFIVESMTYQCVCVCVSCPPVTGGSFLITRYQSLDLSAR